MFSRKSIFHCIHIVCMTVILSLMNNFELINHALIFSNLAISFSVRLRRRSFIILLVSWTIIGAFKVFLFHHLIIKYLSHFDLSLRLQQSWIVSSIACIFNICCVIQWGTSTMRTNWSFLAFNYHFYFEEINIIQTFSLYQSNL